MYVSSDLKGFGATEHLVSPIMGMKLHMVDPTKINVDTFEKETLAELNVFSGEGYATAYYICE
ncbi:hypothetical protein GCM10007384_08730 [Aquimarina muelleri]|uniref:Uncharacterized protein n=1 Tax=Aquimarina muelleri TaxID=279356 RepID=A0A918JTW3_9FLAO|nr:hypothetical protein GCM10007384_08730 [Aquimarina muelleri]